ncbi:hypothetical protein [Caballeronia sp. LZ032]|uniref:hypothetical protein n=1 Tax=Caballeronia sp. LZ032 TaxID=3038565 RepID=UPI0028650B74|nr:hypothetical protein [Caballeronia sp. LZ032]MDR5881144.1 hypothetical protein [Caballeronia sp. LZ032]
MVTKFRRREADRASLTYDRLVMDPTLERWKAFEQRLHGFDVAIIIGLGIAVLGLPAVFLILWVLRT